jgi:hypothetical protein
MVYPTFGIIGSNLSTALEAEKKLMTKSGVHERRSESKRYIMRNEQL